MSNKQLIQLLVFFLIFILGAVLNNVQGWERLSLYPLAIGGAVTLYFLIVMTISWLKNRK